MSERLTDAHIEAIWAFVQDGNRPYMSPQEQRMALAEIKARRAADPAVLLIATLAGEVIAERPPLPGRPNTMHAKITEAIRIVDKLIATHRSGT